RRLLYPSRGRARALVLSPTRELAAQIEVALRGLAKGTRIHGHAVYGGVGMSPQEHALRAGVDVVVATPGRLLDHMSRRNVDFRGLEVLVLDEADRMLDMGFLPDVRRIVGALPRDRQTLLFSATMPSEIEALSRTIMRNPVRISVSPPHRPPSTIRHEVYPVPQHLKTALLVRLLGREDMMSVLVFVRTKRRADGVARQVGAAGFEVVRIHGARSQSQRETALRGFGGGRRGDHIRDAGRRRGFPGNRAGPRQVDPPRHSAGLRLPCASAAESPRARRHTSRAGNPIRRWTVAVATQARSPVIGKLGGAVSALPHHRSGS